MQKRDNWHINDLLAATGGALVAGSPEGVFSGICIDSRVISRDQVFVAVKGERYDGHAFIPKLMNTGIKGLIVEDVPPDHGMLVQWARSGGCCILVDDTIQALGELASFHRRRLEVQVAAITGSNGKTTTKELVAAILGRERNIIFTRGNLNNEIGLPLTLLRLDCTHRTAIVELGMNHPGEIRGLAEISEPDVGVITNIGPAHLEGVRGVDQVMAAKAELFEHVRPSGTVVLNADDAYAERLSRKTQNRICWFGFSAKAHVRAESVEQRGTASAFELILPGCSVAVALQVPGRHMVSNALAAAGTAYVLGVSGEAVKAGLESFRPLGGRMAHNLTARGIHVIDDAYNANPASMKAAIEVLTAARAGGRTFLVAGDMLELGEGAAALHYEAGRQAALMGVDHLLTSGDFAGDFAGGARAGGMDAGVVFAGSKDEIFNRLCRELAPGDWVLVKGSRSTGMDEIAKALVQREPFSTTEGSV
ncbi:MAG: UDP-N-acetylmuramoyl-tripeptide--D-alanyl-D-alanine ligase [Desulfosalsimonadaceae bacterium]